MRRTSIGLVLALASLLAACGAEGGGIDGSAVDQASSFAGRWSVGGYTMYAGPPRDDGFAVMPPLAVTAGSVVIKSRGINALEIPSLCPGEDLVPASVVSETRFDLGPYACTPIAETACQDPTAVQIDRGAGTVTEGQLAIQMSGTYTVCGTTYAFMVEFTGYR